MLLCDRGVVLSNALGAVRFFMVAIDVQSASEPLGKNPAEDRKKCLRILSLIWKNH